MTAGGIAAGAESAVFRTIDISGCAAIEAAPAGAAPHLGWVEISKLVIDDSYQRGLTEGSWRAIRRIAERFDWNLFSAVDVSPVEGGRYAIVDGQHRTHAAALIGIAKVPCRVCLADRAGQARAFAAINGEVTAITPFHIYKAALAAGEPWAKAADALCREAGCRLMTNNTTAAVKKPREIYAITFVRDIVERNEEARSALKIALTSLAEAKVGQAAIAWEHKVLRSWCVAVQQLDEWLKAPGAARALTRFLDRDVDLFDILDDAARRVREARRRGDPTAPAHQIATGAIAVALDRRFPDQMSFARAGE